MRADPFFFVSDDGLTLLGERQLMLRVRTRQVSNTSRRRIDQTTGRKEERVAAAAGQSPTEETDHALVSMAFG